MSKSKPKKPARKSPWPDISDEDYLNFIVPYEPIGHVPATPGFVAAEVSSPPDQSLRHVWPPAYRHK
jgi:hypothetical protein